MKKKFVLVMAILCLAAAAAFAGGGKVRGDEGQGAVYQWTVAENGVVTGD